MNHRVLWLSVLLLLALLLGLPQIKTWLAPPVTIPPQVLELEAGCQAHIATCVARGEALAVRLMLGPEVVAMQAFPVQLEISTTGLQAMTVERVEIDFVMDGMNMGLNRYTLAAAGENRWHASAILPMCISRRSDWLADVKIYAKQGTWTARFPFQIKAAEQAPL